MKLLGLFVLVSIANISLCLQIQQGVVQPQGDLCVNCARRSRVTICSKGQGTIIVVPQPPDFVYRADFRTPKLVFNKGLVSPGKNDNLLEHTKGISTSYSKKKDTLFVSTSIVLSKAINFAKVMMRASKDPLQEKLKEYKDTRLIYVYKIRADANYFSMYESEMYAFQQTSIQDYRVQAENVAKVHEEWEACGGVRADEVYSSTAYEFGRMESPMPAEMNSKYVAKNTVGSKFAYVPDIIATQG